MQNFKDKIIVITGAGSGMGRTLALQLAQRGALVLLSDIHEVGLAETEHLVQQQGGRCKSYKVDVGDKPQVEAFAKAVLDEFKFIDVLINNAGMAIGKASFDEIPMDDFERLINVNLWGVIQHTKLFLPTMLTRPEAAIVNTSSVFGLFPVPSQVPYCVSKYAVRGFTETLRMELNGTNVAVTCVHPGGIKTNIVNYGIHFGLGANPKLDSRQCQFQVLSLLFLEFKRFIKYNFMRFPFYVLLFLVFFSCNNYQRNRFKTESIDSQIEGTNLKLFFSIKYVSDSTVFASPSIQVGLGGPIDSIKAIYLYQIDSFGNCIKTDSITSAKIIFKKIHSNREFISLNLTDFIEAYNGRYFSISAQKLQHNPLVVSIDDSLDKFYSSLKLEFVFFDGKILTTKANKLK